MKTKTFYLILLRLTLLLPLFFLSVKTEAVRAYPVPIQIQQPDGSFLTIQIRGDEYFHYTTLENGSVIAQKKDGYYYHASYDASGQLLISNQRASASSSFGISTRGISQAALRSAALRSSQKREEMMRTRRAMGAIGVKKSLIILVQFSDVKFQTTAPLESFQNMLNTPNYSDNGGTGSARDYYMENSKNAFMPNFVAFGPVTLSNTMAFYGENDKDGNDKNARKMITDACQAARMEGLNFNDFDTDNDGVVDNVFVYYAGVNEAEGGPANTVWPHSWSVSGQPGSTVGNLSLNSYACTSELQGRGGNTRMAGIGTFCHEFGHVIGLPDFYDTDGGTDGEAPGLYNLSLMCSGNYNNSGRTPPYLNGFERDMLGWMQLTEIVTPGEIRIAPVNNNVAYKIATDTPGEFFVFENRGNTSWDAYIGGSGMLVYHVDQSSNNVAGTPANRRWSQNTLNNVASHQCMDIVEADGRENPADIGNVFFPGKQKITSFTENTYPTAVSWNDTPLGLSIKNIRQEGDDVLFSAVAASQSALEGVVKDKSDNLLEGVKVSLTLQKDYPGLSGGTTTSPNTFVVYTNAQGAYTFPVIPGGIYVLKVEKEGFVPGILLYNVGKGEKNINVSLKSKITTKIDYAGMLYIPYIWKINDIIPLEVTSSKPIKSVAWKLDGTKLFQPELLLSSLGEKELSVTITYNDDLIETIIRSIYVFSN